MENKKRLGIPLKRADDGSSGSLTTSADRSMWSAYQGRKADMSRKSFWAATFSFLLFFAMGMVNRSAAEWTIQAVDVGKLYSP